MLGGALLCGLALDLLIGLAGFNITPQLEIGKSWPVATLQLVCGITLGSLILWRLWLGAARKGWGELRGAYSGARELPGMQSIERQLAGAKRRGLGRWLRLPGGRERHG